LDLIPDSLYSPSGGVRLLSPQAWAQARPSLAERKSTICTTSNKDVTLIWGRKKQFKTTIPLGSSNNVATLRSTPGFRNYAAFMTEIAEVDSDDNPVVLDSQTSIIEDEDEKSSNDIHTMFSPHPMIKQEMLDAAKRDSTTLSQIQIQEKLENASAELLRFHIKYGHIPFARLREMAKQNVIPRRLATCPTPACVACMYGRATRKAWRSKTPINAKVRTTYTKPGECISVDMLTSPSPGFVAQMTGKLTSNRYKYVTVFVDNYSSLGFIYHTTIPR